jgi:hypothetical protein
MDGELLGRRPQVELASGRMALEAAVALGRQIHPELTALGTTGLVYGTRAAERTAVAAAGDETQERQDLFDRDLRSQHGKVDGWHGQQSGSQGRAEKRIG